MSTADLAEQIVRALPHLKTGTLRFWGHWFGRPYDNIHRIIGVRAQDDTLVMTFEEGETLQVWTPVPGIVSREAFSISGADRVRWEWFSYGHPHSPEYWRFMDSERRGDRIRFSTNFPSLSTKEVDAEGAAVELL